MFLQSTHWKGRIPRWMRLWRAKSVVRNSLPQNSHRTRGMSRILLRSDGGPTSAPGGGSWNRDKRSASRAPPPGTIRINDRSPFCNHNQNSAVSGVPKLFLHCPAQAWPLGYGAWPKAVPGLGAWLRVVTGLGAWRSAVTRLGAWPRAAIGLRGGTKCGHWATGRGLGRPARCGAWPNANLMSGSIGLNHVPYTITMYTSTTMYIRR